MIAKLRRYKGLTQAEMGKFLGISLQSYYKKEKGVTPFSDKEKIMLKELFSKDFPHLTIDEIFFSDVVPKVENGVKEGA
ncbi:hypothetical protein NHG35_04700 [Aerococcaceae bacterium NML180378]|nr:hypothetical protein [Aerococcaceae bacterium NML180378]